MTSYDEHQIPGLTTEELRAVIDFPENHTTQIVQAAWREIDRRNQPEPAPTPKPIPRVPRAGAGAGARPAQPVAGRHTFLDFFKPKPWYFVTPILVYLNAIMLFITSIPEPTLADLVKWGGNVLYLSAGDEPWRLVSSIFLHAGIAHYAFNMLALVQVGAILEPRLGPVRYLLLYLACGILASASSIVFNDSVSVGASGAIMGLFGFFFVFLRMGYLNVPPGTKRYLTFLLLMVFTYSIVFGFSIRGIDNAAHIGGLVTGGLIAGTKITYPEFSRLRGAALVAVTLICTQLAVTFIEPGRLQASQAFINFQLSHDELVLNDQKLREQQDDISKEAAGTAINSLLARLETMRKATKSLMQIDPEGADAYRRFIAYYDLQIKYWTISKKYIKKPTTKNRRQLQDLRSRIEDFKP